MNRIQIKRAVHKLKTGGIIAYPTESVFGLGCDAYNLNAISNLLEIKNRSYKMGLIILVSDIRQARPFISPLSTSQLTLINKASSRATTWLIDGLPQVSSLLKGQHKKLAVRLTSNPIAREICELMQGPIVSTSCNRTSKPASSNITVIRNRMTRKVDQIIAGECCGQRPSRIVDLENNTVVRH